MEYNRLMVISCQCNNDSFIHAFNFIDILLKDYKASREYYRMFKEYFEVDVRSISFSSESGKFSVAQRSMIMNSSVNAPRVRGTVDLGKTIVLLKADVPEVYYEYDIAPYRYFILAAKKLLRRQDFAVISCDESYYYRIRSYFAVEAMFPDNNIYAYYIDKLGIFSLSDFCDDCTFSREWFPALCPESKNIYKLLVNPIISSYEDIFHTLSKENNYLYKRNKGVFIGVKKIKDAPMELGQKLKLFFRAWICYVITNKDRFDRYTDCADAAELNRGLNIINADSESFRRFVDRFFCVSGLTQMLFSVIAMKKLEIKSNRELSELESLLEICCDLGNSILQVSENVVSHTLGGVLSIRSNMDWNKIRGDFKYYREQNSFGKADRYLRISLLDYSHNGIVDNIRNKVSDSMMTFKDIFDFEASSEKYRDYLQTDDQIIHHYGLRVFRDIVSRRKGCFYLISGGAMDVPASDKNVYSYESELIGKPTPAAESIHHIPGSEYDIIFLVNEADDDMQKTPPTYNTSLIVSPKMLAKTPEYKIVFEDTNGTENNDTALQYYLNREMTFDPSVGFQQAKESFIKTTAELIFNSIVEKGDVEQSIYYFFISKHTGGIFDRIEIAAKILMKVIAMAKKNGFDGLKIVLYGLTEHQIIQFTRQYSLFYSREAGNQLMDGSQLYVVSDDYSAEILFAGSSLTSISEYCAQRRLTVGYSSIRIEKTIDHIALTRCEKTENKKIYPFPFDLLNRMESLDGGATVIKSEYNKWYYHNLDSILEQDIHGENLGCKLENVHVQTGGIHLTTFYEGQLLFSNTYWYQVFSDFICEQIKKDTKIAKDQSILLYGYETYLEQMLRVSETKLKNNGYNKITYAIYEAPKYISATQTGEKRIRYIEDLDDYCSEGHAIVCIMGVGQTLSTIKNMLDGLGEKRTDSAYKKGIVIIQIAELNDRSSDCEAGGAHVVLNDEEHTVKASFNGQNVLSGLTDIKCVYLVDRKVKWQRPSVDRCDKCYPDSYLNEKPLIATNESSTIPNLLISPNKPDSIDIQFIQKKSYSDQFLSNPENCEYLYYSHLKRGGNHYQYYLRTAHIVHDLEKKNAPALMDWFNNIRDNEYEHIEEKDGEKRKEQINIIVSPLHFSSEAFVSAVNKYVFDGSAYLINFDIKKEFRESFAAKFQNYKSAVEILAADKKLEGIEINFYFVDDDINTGTTYFRAKSLIASLMNEIILNDIKDKNRLSVNLFKAIIVLTSRNSHRAFCNYFDNLTLKNNTIVLPVYCFLELRTPSIRSVGGMCPICSKVERIKRMVEESSLTFVEHHWRKKYEYHGLKDLSSAKTDRVESNAKNSRDPYFKSRGFRRLQCSEIVYGLLKDYRVIKTQITDKLEKIICDMITRQKDNALKTEYLISFFKVLSREHIVNREYINDAALTILLSTFSVFIDGKVLSERQESESGVKLYSEISNIIQDSSSCEYAYLLYKVVIARLCSMGSNVLSREDELKNCIKKGLELQGLAAKRQEENGTALQPVVEKDDFMVFLVVQIKKMLTSTSDIESRVTNMQELLEKLMINEETGEQYE